MQIKLHSKYVQEQIENGLNSEERETLLQYHIERVRDFQHERLVHLLVTFFFAGLFLGSLTAWLFVSATQLFWPLSALTAILFVLELAYIRHYYLLENGVQSLYVLTEKLKV